ncbi:helicase-associated domain-containing protein [Planctomonas deserti]|uniref:helicase-associated domain-containing protein n=1 Tax=Planctomonas deserti TaxID=2144185 RepID=UPI000D3ADE94|nr:helicase-associated domain-containing protein [Planctomonas deserti]
MSTVLALATRLRAMPDGELLSVLRARAVPANGIADVFDLADALLSAESVQRALERLDRPTLCILASAGALAAEGTAPTMAAVRDRILSLAERDDAVPADADERAAALNALLLAESTGDEVRPYEGVRAQLERWPELGLPSEAELAAAAPPPFLDAVDLTREGGTDRLAAERAFATVTAVTELVAALAEEPARELSRGGLALPDTKRLSSALAVDLSAVPAVLAMAERVDLAAREGNLWLPTGSASAWSLESSADRWCSLARSWLDGLSEDVRGILRLRSRAMWGEGLLAFVAWAYPAGQAWLNARIDSVITEAELLGITAQGSPSVPGSVLLEHGAEAAADVLSALFPAEVDRVYVQQDLSIVSPGPLAPALDARLRTMAHVESRAQASTYRVSADSVNRALASGETADSVLEFLRGISLTGIPQPLDYLVHDVASRFGLLRVGRLDTGDELARSYVRSDDAHLLTTLEVDQALAALRLTRSPGGRLSSPADRDAVFWALADARYPAAAEDREHRVVPLRRARVGSRPIEDRPDPARTILDRLRLAESSDPNSMGADWLARQLDIAIRGRLTLIVRVAMPNGAEVQYELEPTGLSGGRLRARDRRADIERTLPVSHITGLGPSDTAQ